MHAECCEIAHACRGARGQLVVDPAGDYGGSKPAALRPGERRQRAIGQVANTPAVREVDADRIRAHVARGIARTHGNAIAPAMSGTDADHEVVPLAVPEVAPARSSTFPIAIVWNAE